jgi:hypothetical protein
MVRAGDVERCLGRKMLYKWWVSTSMSVYRRVDRDMFDGSFEMTNVTMRKTI